MEKARSGCDENIAVNLFLKAIRFNGCCLVRVFHDNQTLITVNVSAKDVKEFQDLESDVKHLIGMVKSAI